MGDSDKMWVKQQQDKNRKRKQQPQQQQQKPNLKQQKKNSCSSHSSCSSDSKDTGLASAGGIISSSIERCKDKLLEKCARYISNAASTCDNKLGFRRFKPYGSQNDCDYMRITMERGVYTRQPSQPAYHKMKLKDFVYSTLPRRNNKKSRSKSTGDHVTSTILCDNVDNNRDSDTFPIQYNKSLVTEDFQYKESDFDNCNRYNSFTEFECEFIPISAVQDNANEDDDISGKSTVQCPVDFGDVNFNTIPRYRTRIKTNPWLPSPKTSPTPSGITSPMTSSIGSSGVPEFSQGYNIYRDSSFEEELNSHNSSSLPESGFSSSNIITGDNSDDSSCNVNTSALAEDLHQQQQHLLQKSPQQKNSISYYIDPGSCHDLRRESIDSGATEFDSIMQTSFVSEIYDYSTEDNKWHDNYNGYISTDQHTHVKDSYDSDNWNGNNNDDHDDQRNNQCDVCFDYEADFEEQVENNCYCEDVVGSRDDIFDVFNSSTDKLDEMDTQNSSDLTEYSSEMGEYYCNENEDDDDVFMDKQEDIVKTCNEGSCMSDNIVHSSDKSTQAICGGNCLNHRHFEDDSDETVQTYRRNSNCSSSESDIVYNYMDQMHGNDKMDIFEGGPIDFENEQYMYENETDICNTKHPRLETECNVYENKYKMYVQNKADMFQDEQEICSGYNYIKSPVSDPGYFDTGLDITSEEHSKHSTKASSVVSSVRFSLEDKVRKLKQDKEVVDDIVRKAREEDRLKRMELIRIQKQTTLARKEILLKTLTELRAKLEDQTNRLQSAYEKIITLQFTDTVKRKSGSF